MLVLILPSWLLAGIALVVTLHGITNKKWEQAHTVGTVLGSPV